MAWVKMTQSKSKIILTAQLLIAVAISICIFLGVGFALFTLGMPHLRPAEAPFIAFFGLAGFVSGLVGVLALRRRRFSLAIIGIIFLTPEAIALYKLGSEAGLMLGTSIITLIVLALTLTIISRGEFGDP